MDQENMVFLALGFISGSVLAAFSSKYWVTVRWFCAAVAGLVVLYSFATSGAMEPDS